MADIPPGKRINVNVNDDDDDADGLPDREDFDNPNEDDFVPMVLVLPRDVGISFWQAGLHISLDYDPALLRVWTKPGNVPRDPRSYWIWDEEWQTYRRGGDVVEPLGRGLEWPDWVFENGYWRPGGPPLTLYVEALAPSAEPGDARIAVHTFNYTYHITTSLGSDAVRFTAVGKKVDLDIDSDNTNGFEPPDRSEAEDEMEDAAGDPERPGKFIQVNDGDRDGDGIADYFDGFDANGTPGDEDDGCEGGRFVPIVIELPSPPGPQTHLRFAYSACDPSAVAWDSETGAYSFPEGDRGKLRLWRADASSARRKAPVTEDGDFIPSGVDIPASCLPFLGGKTASLYIEAIRPSSGLADARIEVELDPGGYAEPVKDAVRCQLIQLQFVIPSEYDDATGLPKPNAAPIPTDFVGVSDPRPTVTLDEVPSSAVTINEAAGTATLTIRGVVRDPIADNVPRGKVSAGLADIDSVAVYVDGATYEDEAQVESGGEPERSGFWCQHPYRGTFGPVTVTWYDVPVDLEDQISSLVSLIDQSRVAKK